MARPTERIAFETDGFAVVVCRHPDGRFLAVEESRERGWWLPAGHVDRGQSFVAAAIRETQEEAGIDVELRGVLAVEHTLVTSSAARMRVIFYAVPRDPSQPPKSVPDAESNGAAWHSLADIEERRHLPPPAGLRGEELLRWGRYVSAGGLVAPMAVRADGSYDGFFRQESSGPAETSPADLSVQELRLQLQLQTGAGGGIDAPGEKQWTALHRAVAEGDLERARLLLLAGADPNRATHKGRTTLHFAAARLHTEMARLLLLAGADPQLLDSEGKTAAEYLGPAHGGEGSDLLRLLKM